jgi:hypothetical protein
VYTREPGRASLRVQPVVERGSYGDDTTARTCPGFQDDDRRAGFVKKISSAQASETGADDHDREVGIARTHGDVANGSQDERDRTRRLLEKSPAIHALLFVR